MPRVRTGANQAYASPVKTVQIALNDDTEEKAARLHSRQALFSRQMDQLKAAAASPAKKQRSTSGGAAPHTPSQYDDPYGVRGDAVTPMKRVPILANFEEWMKMATDNKINANNSWNFALIDYFHDLSLLKEGDGVNFQKASCTLDGCVKIYTSRVDSVATETGKLLSGLAESGSKKKRSDDTDGEAEGEDAADEDDEGGKKKRSRTKRSAEATLVSSFEQLRLKKMELEFSIDPLFKKASADFDEGGAKGLLLNHLSIDGSGRIVFDSSDDANDEEVEEERRDSMDPASAEVSEEKAPKSGEESTSHDGPIDIAALGARFFPDLITLDTQDICPSLKTFELGSGDTSLDLPFLKAPENWRDDHPESSDKQEEQQDEGIEPAFGEDDDHGATGLDMPDIGFGEGGEVWARDAAIQPQLRVHAALPTSEDGVEDGEVGTFDTNATTYGVTLQHRTGQNEHDNILNYFDSAMQKNWAGPEHWKITRVKDTQRPIPTDKPRIRKEKEPFEIDFAAPMSGELASLLYTSASSNATISLPKREWKSKSRNLLPDDKHFNSKDLLRLFLKPKAQLGVRKNGHKAAPSTLPVGEGEIDEGYWASANAATGELPDPDAPKGDYDANFFADDNLPFAEVDLDDDDEVFADAREAFSPDNDAIDAAAAGPTGSGIDGIVDGSAAQGGHFGAQLITQARRLRPEYVQYARVAKKVDVRRLKEEIWKGIGFEKGSSQPSAPQVTTDESGALSFTDVMNNLHHVYPKRQLADISTSYGFICLLHLANEKGLVIENVEGWQDLRVRQDMTVTALETEAC